MERGTFPRRISGSPSPSLGGPVAALIKNASSLNTLEAPASGERANFWCCELGQKVFFRPEGPAGAEPRPQGRSPDQGADFGPFYAPFAPKRVKFAQVTDPKTSRIAILFHQGHRTHWGAMSYIGICRQERYMILKIAKITLATEQP